MRRRFRNVQTLLNSCDIICGSFLPNGSSAIANASNTGDGFTVTYNSTGNYTITFDDAYNKLISIVFQPQLNAATSDIDIQIRSHDVTTAATGVTFENVAAGSAADIASNANNRIYFIAVLSRSSLD